MTDLVPADQIEEIVGAPRHATDHLGIRTVYDPEVGTAFYILHSKECKDSGIDLRECEFSIALDETFGTEDCPMDETMRLSIENGFLDWEELT